MSEVILVDRLGDIRFGAPEDIAPDKKPWGFYEILGIGKDASTHEIKRAIKNLRAKHHPDRFARESDLVKQVAHDKLILLGHIEDTLTDDGGNAGERHSKRAHYDAVSGYSEFFGNGYIKLNGERTRTVSETMLEHMERERHYEGHVSSQKKDPVIKDLVQQAETAQSEEEINALQEKIYERLAELHDISVDRLKEILAEQDREGKEYMKQQEAFGRDLLNNPHKYTGKILDAYIPNGTAIFCSCGEGTAIMPAYHKVGDNVVEIITRNTGGGLMAMLMGGSPPSHFDGFRQVHLKVEKGCVTVKDPNLTGLIQVAEGHVELDFDASSYGEVIRVKAPEVTDYDGFTRSKDGELYIPERFAYDGWETKTPTLEIAVKDGYVQMEQRSQEISGGLGSALSRLLEAVMGGGAMVLTIGSDGVEILGGDKMPENLSDILGRYQRSSPYNVDDTSAPEDKDRDTTE
jgi:curved DNA-binding protein CbpA